jgi:hypothetical protein
MTSFKVIQGGLSGEESKSKNMTPQEELNMVGNMKIFMRSLESSMASVNQQAIRLSWTQLIKEVEQTHKLILQVLRTIKRQEKRMMSGAPPLKGNPNIKLVYDKDKKEQTEQSP